jgi:hypothetical protein
MEDETGIMNAILTPPTFDRFKFTVLGERFLLIDGVLQNLDGVISVKAARRAHLALPQGAAAALTLAVTFVFSALEGAGIYHAPWNDTGTLMMFLWACAYVFSAWRYR